MKLAGKVAVVTGGSSGIGRACAIGLAREGARIVAVGRDEARLAGVEKEVKDAGGEGVGVKADLRHLAAIDEVIDTAVRRFGGVDVLLNSAGVFELAPLSEVDEAFYQRTMDVNVKSLIFMTKAAAAQMKKQGRGGKIVSLSSIAGGTIGVPTATIYCASKAAIKAFTQALALELAPHKINVNCIAPGNIRSPMNEHLLADPDYLKAMLDQTPWGRIGVTDDIVPAVIYLASEDADYITGQQMVIDGGCSCP